MQESRVRNILACRPTEFVDVNKIWLNYKKVKENGKKQLRHKNYQVGDTKCKQVAIKCTQVNYLEWIKEKSRYTKKYNKMNQPANNMIECQQNVSKSIKKLPQKISCTMQF